MLPSIVTWGRVAIHCYPSLLVGEVWESHLCVLQPSVLSRVELVQFPIISSGFLKKVASGGGVSLGTFCST